MSTGSSTSRSTPPPTRSAGSCSRSPTRASLPPRRPKRGSSSTTRTSTCRHAAGNRTPERRVANEMRRDTSQLRQNDHFAVLFDTFHDKRNGYIFYANAIGGLADGQITDEGPPNEDWNTVWDVKTGRFDGGWTIEMAIPFKSLRYQPGRRPDVGDQPPAGRPMEERVVAPRRRCRARSTTFRGILKVSSAGTLDGLQVPSGGRNLELKPYALAGVSTDRTVTPLRVQRPDRPHRRGPEIRHHAEPDGRPHHQHRLRAGGGRRAAGQPDPLRPVLSREARLLPRGPRHVCVRRPRQLGRRRGRRRHAVPLLQPAHRPGSVARDSVARWRPRERQSRQGHLRRDQRANGRRGRREGRGGELHRAARQARHPAAQQHRRHVHPPDRDAGPHGQQRRRRRRRGDVVLPERPPRRVPRGDEDRRT